MFNKKVKKKIIKARKYNKLVGKEVKHIDYKNVELLNTFINIHGRILSAKVTGLTALQQRSAAQAIKRARYMALLPYSKDRIKKI